MQFRFEQREESRIDAVRLPAQTGQQNEQRHRRQADILQHSRSGFQARFQHKDATAASRDEKVGAEDRVAASREVQRHTQIVAQAAPSPRTKNRLQGYQGHDHGVPLLRTYADPRRIGRQQRQHHAAAGEKPNKAHCSGSLVGSPTSGLIAAG